MAKRIVTVQLGKRGKNPKDIRDYVRSGLLSTAEALMEYFMKRFVVELLRPAPVGLPTWTGYSRGQWTYLATQFGITDVGPFIRVKKLPRDAKHSWLENLDEGAMNPHTYTIKLGDRSVGFIELAPGSAEADISEYGRPRKNTGGGWQIGEFNLNPTLTGKYFDASRPWGMINAARLRAWGDFKEEAIKHMREGLNRLGGVASSRTNMKAPPVDIGGGDDDIPF